jgi:glycosyltransferase involved in cell wall biosynthesis
MKTALLLAYYYPPLGGIGSMRSQKFARYLPEFGWRPVVIAPDGGAYWVDSTLEDGARRGVKVIRTPTLDFGSVFKNDAAGGSFNGSANHDRQKLSRAGNGALLNGLKRIARTWVYIPDGQVGWFPYALRAGRQLIETDTVDVIWSTSFPVTAHLVAHRLKARTNKPWVAEFRDPWTTNGNLSYSNRFRKSIDRIIESDLLEKVDAVVTVSNALADQLRKITGGRKRIEVIRNGFDREDFAGIERAEPAKWTITFVGTYYSFYDPSPLLAALQRLVESRRVAREDVQIAFVGEANPKVQELATQFGLADVTRFTGFISHREAIKHQVDSSLLLFALHGEAAQPGHITGKLYEYIAANRPILGIVPADFEAAQIIRQTGRGAVFEPTDSEGVERYLIDSYDAFKSGRAWQPGESDISLYERREGARQLADLLGELTRKAPC